MMGRRRELYAVLAAWGVAGLALVIHFFQSQPDARPSAMQPFVAPPVPKLKQPSRRAVNAFRDGIQCFEAGLFRQSVEAYTDAIDLSPDYPEALCNRANTYLSLGEPALAIKDCTAAIELNPRYALAYTNRGLALSRLRKYTDATGDHETALKYEPDNAMALNNLAWLLATCPDDSIRDGKRAVELANRLVGVARQPRHLIVLAVAQSESGQFKEALASIEEALPKLDPVAAEKARALQVLFQAGKVHREP